MTILLFPISLVALSGMALLVWALYVLLTTPQQTWESSGMSQIMWLAVVIFMPLIGSVLFAAVGHRRLKSPTAPSKVTT